MKPALHPKNTLPFRISRRAPMPQPRKSGSHAGQSIIEFAIVLPLLLLIFLGAVDFGRAVYLAVEVANAARAGAQYGAQSQTTAANTTQMAQAARDDASDISSMMTVTPTRFCECASAPGTPVACSGSSCSGSRLIMYVRVVTSVTYSPWFPYPGIPSSTPISATSVMRVGL
jgi:Flp pilus assembly protein TadG